VNRQLPRTSFCVNVATDLPTPMAMSKQQLEMYRSMSVKMSPAVARRLTSRESRLHRLKSRYECRQSIVKTVACRVQSCPSPATELKTNERKFIYNKPEVIVVNFDEDEIAGSGASATSATDQQQVGVFYTCVV
jgi:hypothetical protein